MADIQATAASTPIYGLPFPDGTDAPTGAPQIQALAQAMDTALTDVSTRPNPIRAVINFANTGSVATGTMNTYFNFSLTVQRGGFTVSGNRLFIPVAGSYWVSLQCRSQTLAAAPSATGYSQFYLQSPQGTNRWPFLRNSQGASFTDTSSGGIVRHTAGQDLSVLIQNQTGQPHTYSGWLQIVRIGP